MDQPIEALKQQLSSELELGGFAEHINSVLAIIEPYILLDSPPARRLTDDERTYIAAERAAKRENQARQKI